MPNRRAGSSTASSAMSSLRFSGKKKNEEAITLKLFAGDYKSKKSIIRNEKDALEIKSELEKASYKVSEILKKETSRTPPPPFTTSTLQQAAINSLGFQPN